VFCGLLVELLRSQAACADVFDDLEVHGFANQGFVKTTANSFFGDSERGSFDFTELGINATIEPSPSLRLSGQLLSRRAGEMYDGSPHVDFALADFSIRNTTVDSIGLLLGRIKNPLGLFNETRDVAFTRPGIFLPQVVYYDKVRNLFMSSDGVAVKWNLFYDAANVELFFGVGKPLLDENVEHGYLGASFAGDLETDGVAYITRLLVETPADTIRAAFSIAKTSMGFQPSLLDPIGNGNVDFVYGIASLQLSIENWTITAEYMREPTNWDGFTGSIFDGMTMAAEGYYMQAAWQPVSNIEFMVRYGEGFADRNDRSGEKFSRLTFASVPAHTRYSKALVTGIRWDVSSNFMLRAEFQRHKGTFILSSRENPDPVSTQPDWNMFAISASYRF
jgi:hypothetical protein